MVKVGDRIDSKSFGFGIGTVVYVGDLGFVVRFKKTDVRLHSCRDMYGYIGSSEPDCYGVSNIVIENDIMKVISETPENPKIPETQEKPSLIQRIKIAFQNSYFINLFK